MLQQFLLLTIPTISTKAMSIPGHEFSTKLCATRTIPVRISRYIDISIGIVNTEKCEHPGFGAATDSLSGDRILHWCLQDFMNVTHNNKLYMIPSGCSLWVKEIDDMPMRKLSEVRSQNQTIPNGNLVTQECNPRGTGRNPESTTLKRKDHWCRQEKILIPFAGDDPFPSGCSCYVRD